MIAIAALLVVIAALVWLLVSVMSGSQASSSGDGSSSEVFRLLVAAGFLALAAGSLFRPVFVRRRRRAVRVVAEVVRIDRKGRRGADSYRETPVLAIAEPGRPPREVVAADDRRGLRRGAVVDVWIDRDDPAWATVAGFSWRGHTSNFVFLALGLWLLAQSLLAIANERGSELTGPDVRGWVGASPEAFEAWLMAIITTATVGAGLAVLAWGHRRSNAWRARAVEASGSVTGFERGTGAFGGDPHPSQRVPLVSFRAQDGEQIEGRLEGVTGKRLRALHCGESVRFRYDPAEPDILKSVESGAGEDHLGVLALVVLAVVFVALMWWSALSL